MRHTQSKWQSYSYYDQIDEEEKYGVCSGHGTYICEEANKTNANLIASAPEMLQALKDSLMVLHEYQIEESRRNELWDLIAKAEGK